MPSRTVLEMSHLEARAFFKKSSCYVNFELPPYINFDQLIKSSSTYMQNKQLSDICKRNSRNKPIFPCQFDEVNYTILSNKDGAFSWRPLKIIHPILYIDMVNLITDESNWKTLTERFNSFSKTWVECISVPRESQDNESDRAWQITNWWESIEQETIKQAFRFSYLATTDVTDCYGSIYTHSFEWALDESGREGAKQRKKDGLRSGGVGEAIDKKLQNLNSAQTNGIPQGSTLMDFLAEVILGYADELLTTKLRSVVKVPKKCFRILRYRDDYRILAESPVLGNQILKQIDVVLYELGLKMSPSKTKTSSDIIMSAIKPEKLESIYTAPAYLHFQKNALRIYQLSRNYPNSGLVSKELAQFYDSFVKPRFIKHVDYGVLVSIFVMIGITSPKTIHLVAGILSKIMEKLNSDDREKIIVDIINKFDTIPNSGLLDIWLQRISGPMQVKHDYSDKFTEVALERLSNSSLWNNEWLLDEGVNCINSASISQLKTKIDSEDISYVIERDEFELYRVADYW